MFRYVISPPKLSPATRSSETIYASQRERLLPDFHDPISTALKILGMGSQGVLDLLNIFVGPVGEERGGGFLRDGVSLVVLSCHDSKKSHRGGACNARDKDI